MSKRARKMAMGVAAVGVATSVAGVAATQPASISASPVDLAALIVVGSSTNPSGEGVENFFGGKFNNPLYTGPGGDDIVHVNFLSGLSGIRAALEANAGEQNAILASGWGAANAGLLLLLKDPAFSDTVVILDNDVARPNGGFGTRYPWFSLIGVNPFPTPSDTDALATVNIGYEYDYNSNAPADVFNPFAAVNALAAYLNTRLNQAELDLPVNADGTPSVSCDANTCAITAAGDVLDCADARCSSPGDRITAYVTTRDNTTYVTYTTEELPLTRLIRTVLGDWVADVTAPLLKLAVDAAYYGGNPIPSDPSAYRPARLFPSPGDVLATLAKIPAAIQETLAAATAPLHSGKAKTTEAPDIEAPDTEATDSDADETTNTDADTDTDTAADTTENSDQTTDTTDAAEGFSAITDAIESISKPLRNVVRDSTKARPGVVGADTATVPDTEPVDPQDDSTTSDVMPPEPSETGDTDTDDSTGTAPSSDTGAAA